MRIFKCVLLGKSGVGKSSIILRSLRNYFDENMQTTIGATFNHRIMKHKNGDYRLEIWDTAGQERYSALMPLYYRDAHIVIIVYDVTDRYSFEYAKNIYTKIKRYDGDNNMFFLMIGNKCDQTNRMVDENEISRYCDENKLTTFECSAKNGMNVDRIFETIGKHMDPYLVAMKNDTIDLDAYRDRESLMHWHNDSPCCS